MNSVRTHLGDTNYNINFTKNSILIKNQKHKNDMETKDSTKTYNCTTQAKLTPKSYIK